MAAATPWHRFRAPLLILVAAAVAASPIARHGPFCGDDSEFHLISWLDAQQSWLHGIPYPHWTPSPNYGAGEPRFLFYPPLTWMLGAALGFVLPWAWVPVAMAFFLLAGTGFATFWLARRLLSDLPATLAAIASIFSVYVLYTYTNGRRLRNWRAASGFHCFCCSHSAMTLLRPQSGVGRSMDPPCRWRWSLRARGSPMRRWG